MKEISCCLVTFTAYPTQSSSFRLVSFRFVSAARRGLVANAFTRWTALPALALGSNVALAALVPPPAQLLAGLSIVESDVGSYRPFTIKARFTKPYCLSDYPGFAYVTLRSSVLNVQISHLSTGTCVSQQERSIRINGIAAGTSQVRVALTATLGQAFSPPSQPVELESYEAEAAQVSLEVKKLPGEEQRGLCMAQFNLQKKAIGLQPAAGCAGYINDVIALEVGTFQGKRAGAFLAYFFAPNNVQVPPTDPAFQRLYILRYPDPLQGRFATVSAATCERLVAEWRLDPAKDNATCVGRSFDPKFYVLAARNGACPLGSSPVYQLFQPTARGHRYTQNADTYSHLLNNGYVGEGVVWCAPARE